MMKFPSTQYFLLYILIKKFFESINNIMEVKIHLTGEMYGYAHSFCHLKVREKKDFFPLFALNLFGFNFLSSLRA